MQTYEVYYAVGCDSEWAYLGTVQADSTEEALARAREQWTDYDPRELAAMEVTPLLIGS